MEIRIGIVNSPRELSFETEGTPEEIRDRVQQAAVAGDVLIPFTDSKGKQLLVSAASIAYVEIGADTARRVGFVG